MFTATMPIWIGVLIIVPLFLLAITGFAGWWKCEEKDRSDYWRMDKSLAATRALCNVTEKERDEARTQRDKLNTENAQLHQDLTGTRATIKARDLEMASLHAEKIALQIDNEAFSETIDSLLKINSELEEKLCHGDTHATAPLQEAAPEQEQAVRYQSIFDTGKPGPAKPLRSGRGKKTP